MFHPLLVSVGNFWILSVAPWRQLSSLLSPLLFNLTHLCSCTVWPWRVFLLGADHFLKISLENHVIGSSLRSEFPQTLLCAFQALTLARVEPKLGTNEDHSILVVPFTSATDQFLQICWGPKSHISTFTIPCPEFCLPQQLESRSYLALNLH